MNRYRTCACCRIQPSRVGRAAIDGLPDQYVRELLEQTVGSVFRVGGAALWSQSRGQQRAALARQVGMYLAHVACGLTLTQVGRIFARDRTTVAHACTTIEDLRDDDRFDRIVNLLEGIMRALAFLLATHSAAGGHHARAPW